ncbi:DUF1697 domain-containing protein [Cryobacterium sp. PAMC25264]|uniref:DUF1697 domain-containing protein n=1 Tax=Cryobacterium sp. PAMC25264 TaxID=2861288 RepID=UPI001C628227|nr:DUF1697 domain-containing protein [Cryobacterium sp. PAMC25264]QYF74988.1 DUF1697 domain-containing protein [Cryobacterium sp. PAMC25264]
MTRYIALLRGINVGGINIRMAELAETVRGLGHTAVTTVLASGNVVLETSETDAAVVKSGLERTLSERFGYEAWVVLVPWPRLTGTVADYPFEDRVGWHSYVLFGSEPATLDDLLAAAPELDPNDERVQRGTDVVYWQVRRAVGIKSPFSVLSGKARFKPTTTTRNLRTLRKILAVPDGAAPEPAVSQARPNAAG